VAYTRLGEVTLKTGEPMEVGVVECPEPSRAEQVASLLGHKGPEWRHHIDAALQEPLDDLETRFYLGLIDGIPITNVMIAGARGVGILGHVYTRLEHRRKGACSQLMAVQMGHTRRLGYRVLTLGTGFETPPYWIYHRFGFRSIDGQSGRMKWLASPDAEADWFRAGATTIRPMRWDDWAPLNLLAYHLAEPDEELPRSWVFRLEGHGSLEGSFLQLRLPLPRQSPRTLDELARAFAAGLGVAALTLATEHGAAAGWAILARDPLAIRRGWLLDFYVHPAFRSQTAQLLAALPWPEGARVAAYTSTPDGYRAAALKEAGFRQVAELPGWLARGETPVPLRVFARGA
jgi:GNAT superfamily N-acetyltransferase